MPDVSNANKAIARTVAAVFGGSPRVVEYLDADGASRVAVLHSTDHPWPGVTAYCTIGLSDLALPREVSPPLGVELLAACDSALHPRFAEALSTAAFFWINDGWEPEPGACFREVLRMHLPDTRFPHFFLTDPYLWEGEFRSTAVGDKTVAWLLAVPVSEAEADHAEQHGPDALEELFERHEIDITDPERASVV
ncbi:suppressor of fused domain protein [Plantactinospora sp. WMMC1484]|uniref:suppressor of fused domain protein n=1 Tax=Plantactinospora sp. WMMC1484 TaxID=3404122 RepID=UPI003BF4A6FC